MQYFHGSNDYLNVGTELICQDDYEDNWSRTDFYAVLEKYRPVGHRPHNKSVFMCDNPDDIDLAGGGTEWIFVVEPVGEVRRHDLNWSSEISCAVSDGADEDTLRSYAENYWNGVPHPDESVWEYTADSAVIKEVHPYEDYDMSSCGSHFRLVNG